MRRSLISCLTLTSSLLPAAVFAASAVPSPTSAAVPQTTLATMCRAEGGTHWRTVSAIADEGTLRSEGLIGSEHDLFDLRGGRQRAERQFAAYASAGGIDAHGAWRQDRSGQVHPLNSHEADTLAVTDRWLAQRGYCKLQRLPASLKRLTAITKHGVTYDRIDATPPRGRTVTMWIGRRHHHLARTVMLRSFQTVTTRYGNYRNVQSVELPFRISTDVGNPQQADVETIHHYHLLDHVPAKALQRPDNAVTDARIAGDKPKTVVPFTYGNTHLLIEARIDGKGPFPFVLDTGGHAILTPATAKLLDLKTHGAGRGYGAGSGSIAVS
ncbi:MAG: hypothetical protein ACRESR_04780, partial [Gammaproteobacteria bacterium]